MRQKLPCSLYLDNFIACPDGYPVWSVHPAHPAGENAAELEAGAGTGPGEKTGKTLKYIQILNSSRCRAGKPFGVSPY